MSTITFLLFHKLNSHWKQEDIYKKTDKDKGSISPYGTEIYGLTAEKTNAEI